jgi:hypothetical protein
MLIDAQPIVAAAIINQSISGTVVDGALSRVRGVRTIISASGVIFASVLGGGAVAASTTK